MVDRGPVVTAHPADARSPADAQDRDGLRGGVTEAILEGWPTAGLVIGAPGITLDLGGHTIDGDAVPAGEQEAEAGIDNTAGHDDVTVKNGAIREFDVGVSLPEVTGNRLRGLRVFHNAILGMDLDLSDHSVIEDSTFSGNGADFGGPGIFLIGSHHNRLEDNLVAGNGGAGLFQLDSSGNRVEDNSFVANADEGLFLGDSEDNRVTGNLAARNAAAGMIIEADRNALRHNHVRGNGDGIVLVGNGSTIARNDVIDTVGCPDGCGYGISFEGGSDNLIRDNTVVGARSAGIRVTAFPPDTPEAIHTAVLGNVVRKAGADGLLVESSAKDTLLEGNFARRSGDDGIDVESPDTILTGNAAHRNHDLGIEAVLGVTDGGGNRARRNGNPGQCTGLRCGG